MKTASQPSAAPSFGKNLAVFLTVFALVFAPCVPVSGLGYGSGMGVKSAWGAQNYTFSSGGTVGNETDNLTKRIGDAVNVNVTTGGNLTRKDNASTDFNGGAVYAAGNFVVEGTGTVNFTNNRVALGGTNGTGSGGAIYTDTGNVTISGTGNTTFTENNASQDGGAIYVVKGNVNISGTGNNTFTGNKGQGGGAIFASAGTVNISGGNNTFTGNTANTSSGGAIGTFSGVNISGGNNTFTNNTANNAGGAIFATSGTVTLSGGNNTFTGNNASTIGGGAIRAQDGSVSLSGGNNTFTNNNANGAGGAISVLGFITLTGGNNTFTNNTASGDDLGGGAIHTNGSVTLSDGNNNFTNNTVDAGSKGLGGGAILSANTVTISGGGNNTFTDNNVTVSGTSNGTSGGGAIYATHGINLAGTGNNTFTNNSATVSGTGDRNGGGAIFANGEASLSGNNTFTNNTANVSSSGKYNSGGGAIYTSGSATLSGNNTFTNNSLSTNAKTSGGGAIYAVDTFTLTGGNNTFTNNSANASDTNSGGGAIYGQGNVTLSGGNNTFTNNTAIGNTTSSGGGAIFAKGKGFTISGGNNTFTGNNGSRGGAIFSADNVTISGGNNTFTNNSATDNRIDGSRGGGAIYSGQYVKITGNATFENNTAASKGGAIYANNDIYLIPDAGNTITFKNASDTLAGGLVHIGGEGNTNFEDGFNNTDIRNGVHFGLNPFKGTAAWENSTLNVTLIGTALNTAGWAPTTGSGRATPYSAINGNFALGENQTLSLDMNVTSKTSVPYFTVNGGDVTTGANTTLHGVIGSAFSAAGSYTYVVFNVTGGNGTGFAPAKYTTNNALVTLANPTFYGDANGGNFTVDVVRKGSGPGPDPDPDPDPPVPPVPPDPPTPDPGNHTEIPENETHSGGVSDNGGGLYSNGTTSITHNATANFTGNTARDSGGGLHSAGSVTVLDNASAVFVNNTAANKGGGIYSGGDIASTGATQFVVSGNTANLGGGVYANGTITLTGHSTFDGNTAKESGGAIFATGDVNIIGSAEFSGNTANGALAGGAIHTDSDVHVTPDETKTIRFITHSDSIRSNNLYVDGIGTGYFNASNIIADTVYVQSGTAQLAAANTFSNTVVKVEGGTLHMGGVSSSAKARMAAMPTANTVTGAGSAASYATSLKGLHMADGTTLSLDMNVAGNADIPYFTLANGYAATTGTGTTLYGVIGQNLVNAADGKWTYSIFSGSSGAAGDFAPANYRTSNTLISLVNPTYANGEFTLDVVRKSQPDPDPDPPVPPVPPTPDPDPPVPPVPPTPEPRPVITGDFMGLFPKNSLAVDMEMILYYDYFYNGGTIAKPGPGTLIGSNAFLDGLMLVLPNGQNAFTPAERLLALDGAASMTDMSGSIEMLRDTGNRLRGQIFATDAVRNSRATMTKANDSARVNLWATPTYSHETGKSRGYYGSVDAEYRFSTYGGVIGLDALVGEGKFRVGGVFTVGHGKIESILTNNDADYVGGALFGAWLPTPEWEIGFYTGYIGQKNDVRQSNILNLKSKFDTSLWQVGTNVQYSTSIGNDGKRKLTAGTGVDVQMFKRDSHGISANGKDVAKMNKADLTQVQIPLTVGIQDTFEFENGSSLTLDGRVGYRLTAGDLTAKGDWSIPGGNYKAHVSGPDADRNTALAGVGALWKKDRLSIGVSYDAELGAKRTNHQLSGQVRWEF